MTDIMEGPVKQIKISSSSSACHSLFSGFWGLRNFRSLCKTSNCMCKQYVFVACCPISVVPDLPTNVLLGAYFHAFIQLPYLLHVSLQKIKLKKLTKTSPALTRRVNFNPVIITWTPSNLSYDFYFDPGIHLLHSVCNGTNSPLEKKRYCQCLIEHPYNQVPFI